ncbi:MAG: Glycosyl transferases group 1 [Syntrophorhabdus sp. PtaU1.Bin058]|nr:MAG: Glycosyl transferases group 1 [Syntrophorhabdus sp. PtaU1.Bin058]
MKKILFFTHNIFTKENPRGYRIHQYFPYLEKSGFTVTLLTTKTGLPRVLREIMQSDITYVQRVLLNPFKLSLFRRLSKRMVYDFDDAVMYGSRGVSTTRQKRFEGMVKASDVVLCGNNFLADEAGKYKATGVHYIPTVVDIGEYPVKQHEPKRPFVIGWIGSSATLKYLADIRGLLDYYADQEGVECKVVADKPPEGMKKGMLFEQWDYDREKQSILSFDMGIMPVKDDIWSLGKCGLKLIQYMAAGLPSVAHPVGVVQDMIVDGYNGFSRKDTEGWKDAIDRLRGDVDLRRAMGTASRKIAEERYSLDIWGPRVAEVLDALIDGTTR